MRTESTMYNVLKLLALMFCFALASSMAVAQSSQTTLVRPEQKPSSAHAILAVVIRHDVRVYTDSSSGHAIGTFPKGSYLVAIGETDRDYRVLAPRHRRVYVAKANIKLLGYTVPVKHTRH